MAFPSALIKLFLYCRTRQVNCATRMHQARASVAGISLVGWEMAGAAGFEPATYGFGDRRSTN